MTKFNCIYCQQLADGEDDGIFVCENCQVTFECNPNTYEIWWIFFDGLIEYQISLNIEHKVTGVFNKNTFDNFIVNYIPDINPTNAQQWLERLLNLRIFL